jgi:hypothetical protein
MLLMGADAVGYVKSFGQSFHSMFELFCMLSKNQHVGMYRDRARYCWLIRIEGVAKMTSCCKERESLA